MSQVVLSTYYNIEVITNKIHEINIRRESKAVISVIWSIIYERKTSTFPFKDLNMTILVLLSKKTDQIINISTNTINDKRTIEPVA